MNLKEKAKALKIYIPALFIAMRRSDTPVMAKIIAGITVGYALSPIDIIPDFIPVLGYLDDLILLPLLASLAIRLIPSEIMDECKAEAEELWKNGKPKKWYFAIPIIILWGVIIAIILYKIIES
jgi:uncharacterized membrane protein YkvA (DUF1232 family)